MAEPLLERRAFFTQSWLAFLALSAPLVYSQTASPGLWAPHSALTFLNYGSALALYNTQDKACLILFAYVPIFGLIGAQFYLTVLDMIPSRLFVLILHVQVLAVTLVQTKCLKLPGGDVTVLFSMALSIVSLLALSYQSPGGYTAGPEISWSGGIPMVLLFSAFTASFLVKMIPTSAWAKVLPSQPEVLTDKVTESKLCNVYRDGAAPDSHGGKLKQPPPSFGWVDRDATLDTLETGTSMSTESISWVSVNSETLRKAFDGRAFTFKADADNNQGDLDLISAAVEGLSSDAAGVVYRWDADGGSPASVHHCSRSSASTVAFSPEQGSAALQEDAPDGERAPATVVQAYPWSPGSELHRGGEASSSSSSATAVVARRMLPLAPPPQYALQQSQAPCMMLPEV